MGSDLPYMAAVITRHVILDERDAYGMRPLIVVHPILPMVLASLGDGGSSSFRHGW